MAATEHTNGAVKTTEEIPDIKDILPQGAEFVGTEPVQTGGTTLAQDLAAIKQMIASGPPMDPTMQQLLRSIFWYPQRDAQIAQMMQRFEQRLAAETQR